MSARKPALASAVAGVGVALVCAVLSAAVLAAVARPRDFGLRLAKVEADAASAERLLHKRDLPQALPADGVCPSLSPEAAQRLRSDLARVGEAFRLEHIVVEVAPEPPARGSDPLAALRIRLEASGQYDAALGALSRLEDVRPIVFIDSADIASKTSFVTLAVSGRAYCSVR